MRRFAFANLIGLLSAAGACFGEAPLIGDDAGANTDAGDSTSAPSTSTDDDAVSTTSTTGPSESSSDSGTDAGAEVGEVGTTADPPTDCGPLDGHRVFVTEGAVGIPGGGWSLDVFDAHCAGEAEKHALVRPGVTFRAIMSDSSTSARQRLVIDCGPLYKQEGDVTTRVAEAGQLWEALEHPIDTTGGGDPITQNLNVWTGTDPSGHSSEATCNDWTGSAGSEGTVGRLGGPTWDPATWISYLNAACDELGASARVYCIEQPL